jgi:hypothetical protein
LKKIFKALGSVALIGALVFGGGLATPKASADTIPRTSGWDLVGSYSVNMYPNHVFQSPIFESTGDNVRIKVGPMTNNLAADYVNIAVYEDDGATDQYVRTFSVPMSYNTQYLDFTIADSLLDGTNNRAELFIQITAGSAVDTDTVNFSFYD